MAADKKGRVRKRGKMNERQTMEYLESCAGYGIVPGLNNICELCSRLENPQRDLKFVHIAGTNGKGSVSTYITTVLQCAGYRVGRYISPVIFQYREGIQVGGKCISVRALCGGVERIRKICDEMTAEGLPHPTPFEMETVLGFLYFKEKKCDIVVLETGMGGLLDATNIIENTVAAVFTSISMDHMKFLGNTLAEIAEQKAGILKPGCVAVSTLQKDEAMKVIERKAKTVGCPLLVSDTQRLADVKYGLEKQRFDYAGHKRLEISLAGQFQIENAALAVDVLGALTDKGYEISEKQLRQGLKEASWPGRFTVIGKKPYFVVDGAHNEDAARRLAESVHFYFTDRRIIYIMGMLRDKEYEKVVELTHFQADQIITVTPPDNPRALSALELAKAVAKVHKNVTAASSLEEAVEMSMLLADREDVILAFGSLSYLGRLMEIAGKKYGKAVK